MFEPVDKREIHYKTTRLRTPSTDQSSGRPSHHKTKRTHCANCLISSIHTQAASLLCVSWSVRTIARRLAKGHFPSLLLLRVLPMIPTHQRLP
ncbi:hypothetical protein NPIL_227271 [Nephila pilipes]|uniref:Uncharacterized protein n=1 Tax=Nephila pilipes TaxID=299642 RepID=A0A8X6MTP0_NEPPI|nr:hypothetical protein NPIL_227271 [Nephila pilipes]